MRKQKGNISSPIATRFSSAAPTYHRLAHVQRRVAERLMELLPSGQRPACILEIGCGTGVLTKMLADAFPSSKIDAVDFSAAMTARARGNLAGNRMINWVVADAGRLPENKKYPLIVSSCALHWIRPIDLIIAKLGALLEQDGRLAFAVMVRGTLAELNSARKRVAPHKPSRVVLPGGDEVKKAVAGADLRFQAEKLEKIRHEYPSAAEMLKQLHDQGLTGGNCPPENALLTRGEISRLIADYTSNYPGRHGVYASYRFYCCIADMPIKAKGQARAGAAPSTRTDASKNSGVDKTRKAVY